MFSGPILQSAPLPPGLNLSLERQIFSSPWWPPTNIYIREKYFNFTRERNCQTKAVYKVSQNKITNRIFFTKIDFLGPNFPIKMNCVWTAFFPAGASLTCFICNYGTLFYISYDGHPIPYWAQLKQSFIITISIKVLMILVPQSYHCYRWTMQPAAL